MVRNKADFLAVRLIGCLKIQLPGHGADLVLGKFSHRHQGMGELLLRQAEKSIGLILFCCRRFTQSEAAVWKLLNPGVMACGNVVGSNVKTSL